MITTDKVGAAGIFAQSVGGGGGAGGSSGGLVALGAGGSTGGAGGTVIVDNLGVGHITTQAADASGIYAQSVGGGGGDGGNSGGLVALGGSGSATSGGGAVTVTNTQAITTSGDRSHAIFAQSIGGGGGNGGFSVGLVSIGGSGGGGGNGNTVKASNSGTLQTGGADASAVFAQSIGGGGGNGGVAVAVGPGIAVAIGGKGAAGGTGGAVTINDTLDANTLAAAQITTTGDRSDGIQAQSIGGGGGNGGFAFAGSVGFTPINASVALGGSAGGGGASGVVTVNEKGVITTGGAQANGVFAQSVGGGGGTGGGTVSAAVGGPVNLGFAMGGTGGTGGDGKAVTVNTVGNIATTGSLANGILAQSVGGGGGSGGFSIAATVGGFSGSVALGGSGGVGGIGNTVIVHATGAGFVNPTISTTGDGSDGILAQSVGGGGGNGGFSGTLAVGGGAVGVGLGGSGAGGAVGGDVTATNSNTITTLGNNSTAIFAQSVGGGGGNGGFALSATGGVMSAAVAVGGKGGGGSNGGTVLVDNSGNITTGKAKSGSPLVGDADYGKLSYGIFAQSVGGGGNGGFAISGALGISVEDIPGGAAAISIGGKGGAASNGGGVTIDNSGGIETYGLGADAIFAQSIGGGGGNGGFAGSVAMTIGNGAAFGVAVGGSASGGGDGGIVNVSNTSTTAALITHAVGADGIFAQSIGGGGGNGGFAFAGAFGFGGEVNINVAVAIGGAGGAGGKGNTVKVDNYAAITTYGDNSDGVLAQSIGGGGGNGGLSVSGTMSISESAGNVGVSVGGGGGIGGIGQGVTVNNFGAITTSGTDAIGILAQSIGGSGGNGGLALTAQMTMSTKNAATVGVSVGGGAGNGNYGGTVDVTNSALGIILTAGSGAHGIKAQSIGGGGGNGGLAMVAQIGVAAPGDDAAKTLNVGVSVGGSGGIGGYGNTVHVINNGSITVNGDTATGIFAQSIGGGGGDGGAAVNAIGMVTDSTHDDSRSVVVTVAVGGAGGSGNYGGNVTVENSGNIVTHGVSGYGIFAQSVGGGGGIGGRANTIAMVVTDKCTLPVLCTAPDSAKNNMQLGVTVGGNGGTGGDGHAVNATNTGTIETFKNTSDGIYAQSVGAGGGNGGNGILGSGEILPVPAEMAAIPIGSVPFYKNLQIVVGGDAGAFGNGGTVDVTNSKNITTHGANSNGIFAQSIGGGGGVAGAGLDGALLPGEKDGKGGTAVIGATGTFGLGGAGGAGGDGAKVTVHQTNGAVIETFGIASDGIFAQSVGGGGGVAGNVDRALANKIETPVGTIPALNLGIGLAFGRSGGAGGDGGEIDTNLDGNIITHGDNSAGIFAQSVGGGGGVLGELGNDLPVLSLLSWQIGSNGDVGNAGKVGVTLKGTIETSGNSATGIFAQSAAGKAGGGHAGTAGDVTVDVTGSVLTGALLGPEDGTAPAPLRGLGSIGILAQSAADDNSKNGNIIVNINGSSAKVIGGRTQLLGDDINVPGTQDGYVGVGVWMMDGKNNTLTNEGLISTLDGVDAGYAILASGSDATHTGGNDKVSNKGTVTGSFDLGAGTNDFTNQQNATLNGGQFANVGSGNTLTNDGWMSPGGTRRVFVTSVGGLFNQTATGTYGTDVDLGLTKFGNEADVIHSTEDMSFAGIVDLTLLHVGKALPGDHSVMIAESDTAFNNNGVALHNPASAVAAYALNFAHLDQMWLDYSINFAPKGLNPNETSIGENINQIQISGGSVPLEPVIEALFNLPDLPTYASGLDQLSPEPYIANEIGNVLSAIGFQDGLTTCQKSDGFSQTDAKGDCAWLSGGGQKLGRATDANNFSYDQLTVSLSGGAKFPIGDKVNGGFALAYDGVTNASGARSDTIGSRLQAGGVLEAVLGDTTISAGLSAGVDQQSVTRHIDLPNVHYVLNGNQVEEQLAAQLHIEQNIGSDAFFLKPSADLTVAELFQNGFTETGDSPVALNIEGHAQTYVTVEPALEIGGTVSLPDGIKLKPYLKAGVMDFLVGDDPAIAASYVAAPSVVSPFVIHGAIDQYMADITLGMDLTTPQGLSATLMGNAKIGEKTQSYGASIKVAAPF